MMTRKPLPLPAPYLSAHSASLILGPNVRHDLFTDDQLEERDAEWIEILRAVEAERDALRAEPVALTDEQIDAITRDRFGSQLRGAMVAVYRDYARTVLRAAGVK